MTLQDLKMYSYRHNPSRENAFLIWSIFNLAREGRVKTERKQAGTTDSTELTKVNLPSIDRDNHFHPTDSTPPF